MDHDDFHEPTYRRARPRVAGATRSHGRRTFLTHPNLAKQMIRAVRKVIIPVENLDVAKEFWTKTIGFELLQDSPYGKGDRWLEVAPPDHDIVLILSQRPAEQVRPTNTPDQRPHSHVMFGCDEIQATYQEMAKRGVRFPTPPTKMPFGWFAMFEDAEGTRYSLSPLDKSGDPT